MECAAGTARYFMSAEDLTTQAGLSVQQDLALVSLLGIAHVERNGHYYVNGMAAQPDGEQDAFLAAASRSVRAQSRRRALADPGRPHRAGAHCNASGYASAVMPDFGAMKAT